MGNTVGSFTQEQKSIIIGSLLGDGYLRIVPGRKNALLEINHSFKQKEYVDWKYGKLKTIVKTPPKMRKSNGGRIAYRFSTRQNPELTIFHKDFYQESKKFLPCKIKFNPLILAVWFMDDGSRSRDTYYLNTQQFDFSSQQQLVEMLENQYGIVCSLNRDKEYTRIRIKQESAKSFKNLISGYIIPSMRYKLE